VRVGLPSLVEQTRLIKGLAALVEACGFEPLVSAPLLEPTGKHFPDAWRADALGVERLARRLLTYAGLPDLGVDVDLFEGSHPDDWSSAHQGTAAWFAGIADGRCHFGTNALQFAEPELLPAIMAHEVAHAYRRWHKLQVLDRDTEERLTDLTTIYLGFGILTTNASYRYRQRGVLIAGTYSGTESMHERYGYLPSEQMSFLLAAQAVVRGLSRAQRRRVMGLLGANQAASFRTACATLDRAAVIERLGLPPPWKWPPVVPPAPLPFDTTNDPPVPPPPAPHDLGVQGAYEGMPVFRVGRSHAIVATFAGFAVGVGAVFAIPGGLGWTIAAGATLVSVLVGKSLHYDRCSEPECSAVIPADSAECPGCGGVVKGRIARQDDRLGAREDLEASAAPEPDPAHAESAESG